MGHPFSLAFLTTHEVSPVEAVRIAHDTGYQKVGLRVLSAGAAGEGDYPLFTDPHLLREVKSALADTGITIADVEIIRLKAENDWDLFARFCERCEALSARHILVAGDDTDRARLTDSFARFAAIAAPHRLTADLEFMPWTAVPDLTAAQQIVGAAGAANGGVLVDALHFDRSASTIADLQALPASRINYVQLCDGPVPYDPSEPELIRIARSARMFPGQGGIDLIALANALPQDVTISIELPERQLASKIDAKGRAAMAIAATKAILRRAGRG